MIQNENILKITFFEKFMKFIETLDVIYKVEEH